MARHCLLVRLQALLFTCSTSSAVVYLFRFKACCFLCPHYTIAVVVCQARSRTIPELLESFLLTPWVSFGIRNTDHHDRNDDDGEHGDCDDVVGHVFPFVACDDLIIQ